LNKVSPAAELERVTFRYPGSTDGLPVLDDVSLRIEADDYLGLVGPNGGGKTTLLKILLGLLKPGAGTVKVFGRLPAEVRTRIGYVPQHAEIDTSVPATVLDVVLMGRLSRSSWGIRFSSDHIETGMEALSRTGVEDLARHSIRELSGGQRQRLLIARALASEAEILLLDEPTAGVDAPMEQSLHELLSRLNERLPIVVVSHDISFVSTHVKRVACLNRQLVCHPASEITAETIAKAYAEPGQLRYIQHTDECPASYQDEEDQS